VQQFEQQLDLALNDGKQRTAIQEAVTDAIQILQTESGSLCICNCLTKIATKVETAKPSTITEVKKPKLDSHKAVELTAIEILQQTEARQVVHPKPQV